MGSDILLLLSSCDQDAVAIRTAVEAECNLVVAADVDQCLQLMGHSPSLILVSDRLDGRISDASSACAEIRKEPAGACAPIVLLLDEYDAPETADTDGVIRRPVDSAVLAAWLQAAQRIARMRQNLVCCGAQECEQLLKSFARLSHAVNNPLQALYATVDMLLLNHGLSQEAATLASEIITHAGRVAKLVAEASGKAKQTLKAVAPERPTQVT